MVFEGHLWYHAFMERFTQKYQYMALELKQTKR